MQSAKNVYSPEDIMRQYRQIRNNGVSNQSTVNNLAENFKKLVVNWKGKRDGLEEEKNNENRQVKW